ncbi:RNA polymerase alpha subunit [Edaphobacter aggregans]|uniref:RNA polymerase alpha subunit n=1 Tax=Edaphobacter aggregans TaxID=570835 RepID=A0A3R9R6A4_9BACT|nr:DNA-directed RNA polymerase subunit alpha C-terminal domain-containing protein [Edaphobacter aggregans]RSL18963.1 RNA polymerase alpha subunit [Edaphobacter aggregans]
MISRYVLWNTVTPSTPPEPVSVALKQAFQLPIDNLESIVPTSLATATRIAIREFLVTTDAGRELAVYKGTQPLWLAPCGQTSISDMDLSVRSFNCLVGASVATLDDLLAWTPNKLLSLEHFGRKCLNEITGLLSDLGYIAADEDSPFFKGHRTGNPSDDGCPFACLLAIREVLPEGPLRTKLEMCDWTTIGDIALHPISDASIFADLTQEEQNTLQNIFQNLSLTLPVRESEWVTTHVSELRRVFSSELSALGQALNVDDKQPTSDSIVFVGSASSLTEELDRLIPPKYKPQKRSIIAALFGLDGADPLTLEEVAKRQDPPMTRERVRQIGSPFLNRITSEGRNLIWLHKALETLTEEIPCTQVHAEILLIERGILTSRLSLTSILKLLNRAGVEHQLILEFGLLLSKQTLSVMKAAVSSARKSSSHWGVADWEEVRAPLGQYGHIIRPILPWVTWLGDSERYFVFPDGENSLANRLARMLHVAPRLPLSIAYEAIFRDNRVDCSRLPREHFASFCGLWPWCKLDGDEIVSIGTLPPVEASGDDLLVILIREFGRPATRQEILQRARIEGIGDVTVNQALSYSNVLMGASGRYWVVGDPPFVEESRDSQAKTSEPSPLVEITSGDLAAEIISQDGSTGHSPSGISKLDPASEQFVERLTLEVQRRVVKRQLATPWSVAELALEDAERSVLFEWGSLAQWDYRRDNVRFNDIANERIRRRAALGLAFMVFAAEAVRKLGGSGVVWPAINKALGPQQRQLFLAQESSPKTMLREGVEEACRVFGIRHDFGEAGHQVWVRTIGVQYAIPLSQLPSLPQMLTESFEFNPISVQSLLSPSDKMYSPSFTEAWNTMRRLRHGDLSAGTAEQRLKKNCWTMHFPIAELLDWCLASAPARATTNQGLTRESEGLAYSYFDQPSLRWVGDNPFLEYALHQRPPAWVELGPLMFISTEPVKKEQVLIGEDGWRFAYAPLSISLSHHPSTYFSFDLRYRGSSQLAEPIVQSLVPPTGLAFFDASGAFIGDSETAVPLDESVTLLHAADVQFEGVSNPLPFRSIFAGSYRLTRFRAGVLAGITVFNHSGELLWTHAEEDSEATEVVQSADLDGARWGHPARLRLPTTDFEPHRVRLMNGETVVLPPPGETTVVELTPSLSRAKYARLQGYAGVHARSVKIQFRHLSQQYGAALEANGAWQALQENSSVETSRLRTNRLLAQSKDWDFDPEEARWMEGSRVIARPRTYGTILTECEGLGAGLCLAGKTYNEYQSGLRAASAVIDVGELRNVTRHDDKSWSALLPFEDPLSAEHCLWAWTSNSRLPQPIPVTGLVKNGSELKWRLSVTAEVFGWALSFRGARVGSMCVEAGLFRFAEHLSRGDWSSDWKSTSAWIRWWHCPVFHPSWNAEIKKLCMLAPVDTCAAWLLPACPNSSMVNDEGREEAWASACRELLWSWRPTSYEARDLMEGLDIWSGDIARDSTGVKLEPIGRLARCNPILLSRAASLAAPELYNYPRNQLVILIRLLLDAINPNAVRTGFDLRTLCERYAQGENRLDGEFILRSLVVDARAILAGQDRKSHNLLIAFHNAGLREIVAIALLLDTITTWQVGGSD